MRKRTATNYFNYKKRAVPHQFYNLKLPTRVLILGIIIK